MHQDKAQLNYWQSKKRLIDSVGSNSNFFYQNQFPKMYYLFIQCYFLRLLSLEKVIRYANRLDVLGKMQDVD